MKKETIKLETVTRYVALSGFIMMNPVTESRVMDELVNWSQEKSHRGKKIYRHIIRIEEENVGKDGDHIEKNATCELRIPYRDLVYYLDIYYQ